MSSKKKPKKAKKNQQNSRRSGAISGTLKGDILKSDHANSQMKELESLLRANMEAYSNKEDVSILSGAQAEQFLHTVIDIVTTKDQTDNMMYLSWDEINNERRKVVRSGLLELTGAMSMSVAPRISINDPEFVYYLADNICFGHIQSLSDVERSVNASKKNQLVSIYERNPSMFGSVMLQKELVHKHLLKGALTPLMPQEYEKVLKVLIRARDREETAVIVYSILACGDWPSSVDGAPGIQMYRTSLCFSEPSRLYYGLEYAMMLRKKFPNAISGHLDGEDDEFYESIEYLFGEKSESIRKRDAKGPVKSGLSSPRDTKVNAASYVNNTDFYESVLETVESLSSTLIPELRALSTHYFGLGDYLGDSSIDRFIEDYNRAFNRDDFLNSSQGFVENKMLAHYLLQNSEEAREEMDKRRQQSQQLKQCALFPNSAGEGNDSFASLYNPFASLSESLQSMYTLKSHLKELERGQQFSVTTMSAFVYHLIVRLYQHIQYSGDIDVYSLLSRNVLKQSEVKIFVNSVFIAYRKAFGTKRFEDGRLIQPLTPAERFVFVGYLADAYIIRVLSMERNANAASYFKLLSGGEVLTVNNAVDREKENLLKSNQDLMRENEELLKRIEELKVDANGAEAKAEISRLHDEIGELRLDVKGYSQEMIEISRERDELESLLEIYEQAAEEGSASAGTEYTEEAFRELIASHKIMLWGAREDAVKDYEKKYPGLVVVDSNAVINRTRLERFDCIIARVDFCNHGNYWNIRNIATSVGVPIKFLTKGQTADRHLWRAACEMLV